MCAVRHLFALHVHDGSCEVPGLILPSPAWGKREGCATDPVFRSLTLSVGHVLHLYCSLPGTVTLGQPCRLVRLLKFYWAQEFPVCIGGRYVEIALSQHVDCMPAAILGTPYCCNHSGSSACVSACKRCGHGVSGSFCWVIRLRWQSVSSSFGPRHSDRLRI